MKQQAKSVKATLQYLADDEDLAVYIASVGGGEVTPHQGNYINQEIMIRNARLDSANLNLDNQGFALARQVSGVSDFYDDEQITRLYEAEIKALVLEVTGANSVEIFDHTRRATSQELREEKKIREHASVVHNDYTDASGPNRLRDFLKDKQRQNELDSLLNRRFAIVNVWRSIGGTVLNFPLAMCDASSISSRDLVSVTRQAQDRIGEIQFALYNPDHRWYYFPELQMDEAILFKTFESFADGRARFTIHSAFDDPTAPADAPPRESLESRCFVFF